MTDESPPGLPDSEKIDRILKLCVGMADTLAEHHTELKFLHAQVDMNTQDEAALATQVRHIKKSVEELTDIAKGHDSRLREDRASIHELQAEEEKRRVASGSDTER